MQNKVIELGGLIENANGVMVLTGAGMDTESNIPDFRSKDGLWGKLDPGTVANINNFYENYSLIHEFFSNGLKLLKDCKPHNGHYVLAELEKEGLISAVATQNISGLHALAGSNNIYELHGNIQTFHCNYCGQPASLTEFLQKNNCKHCSRMALRPDAVLFGEALPEDVWSKTLDKVQNSDILIVIGTSLEVYPVSMIPGLARGKTVYINDEIGRWVYEFDLTIEGKAKQVLEDLYTVLGI
ncbi:MAG: NAD-dependent protein deacylase [Alkaliphilus sp.]|nr:NAD-dependent protein deacylase [Alkaliphilus sp.]